MNEPTLKLVPAIPKSTRTRKINPEAVPPKFRYLTYEVCRTYDVKVPEVRWIRKERESSSGVAKGEWTDKTRTEVAMTHIVISAGWSEVDTKMVLLHELAHWILAMRDGYGDHHNARFWRLAWELYERYEVDLTHAYEREGKYRKESTKHAPMAARWNIDG